MTEKFRITKTVDFCYGHRLLHYAGKCQYLHGHNARLEIEIETTDLDERGMVADFVEIKQKLKGWIDENIDHKMLLHHEDPILPFLDKLNEPYLKMEENPTAENIAKMLFGTFKKMGFAVLSVTLWETPTSSASYRE